MSFGIGDLLNVIEAYQINLYVQNGCFTSRFTCHYPCRVGWRTASETKSWSEIRHSFYANFKSSKYLVFKSQLLPRRRACTFTVVHGGAGGRGTALQTGRSRVRFPMVSLEIFIDVILQPALWPWDRLNRYQKQVKGISPGDKDDRCVGLTTLDCV